MHQKLARHPKLKRLARGLGISEPTAIGHLFLLWSWAMDYALHGDLSDFDDTDIALAMGWDGDPGVLVEALLSCGGKGGAGFLDRSDNGVLSLHDWEINCDTQYIQNAKDAERQKRYRAGQTKNGKCHGDVTVTSQECHSDVTVMSRPRREEKEIKRNKENPPLPPQGGGGAGGGQTGEISPQSPEPQGFGAFWAAYPRRVQRQAAVKAWRGLLRQNGATAADVTEAARAYAEAAARRGTPPDKIMHPATFLHEERWRDWLPPGGASYLEALGAGGRGRAQAPQDAPMTYEEAVARYRGGAGQAAIDVEYQEGGGDSAQGGLSALP